MDYKEKYEQGLECIQEILSSGQEKIKMTLLKERLQPFFPELQESEDERIRKVLIDYFNRYKEQEECGVKTFYEIPTDNILAWLEKQGEKKVPFVDFKAKDCYVSKVDGKIHDMTYDAADKVKPKFKVAEYVYILDYCSGRVIVAKHDLVEPISELFEQLGLKENQCHYMVSDNILSIEYINF